ncbi:SIR2 family protein [Actinomycetospora sp. C-140]
MADGFGVNRRAGFLLGAGSSVDAGLPMAADLTDIIIKGASVKNRNILEFVRSGIQMQRAAAAVDSNSTEPSSRVDSESLYNAVNDLVFRNQLDISPFVTAWHPLLNSFQDRRADSREVENLLKKFQKETVAEARKTDRNPTISLTRSSRDLARRLTHAETPGLPQTILDQIRTDVVKAVYIDDAARVQYLQPLFTLSDRTSAPVAVATLNYDQCLELAGESFGVEVSDGISTAPGDREIDYGAARIKLIKLHGSSNWVRGSHGVTRVAQQSEALSYRSQAILFGGRNKLTAEWPFLELLWRWSQELQQCEDLCIIGYSYRDEHVNAILRNWLDDDPARRVFLIDPTTYNDITHPLGWHVKSESSNAESHWDNSSLGVDRKRIQGPPPQPRFTIIPDGAKGGLASLERS